MSTTAPYYLKKGPLHIVPIIHYNMETAAQVKWAIETIKPDCIAVELPETMQDNFLHAASRLPDISILKILDSRSLPLYILCEPCDGIFEALRSASEKGIDAFCIDLDVDQYPHIREPIPDPYAIQRLGLKTYYEMYEKVKRKSALPPSPLDSKREHYMARRLKELCLRYDTVLFVGGMSHVEAIYKLIDLSSFPHLSHAIRKKTELCTLTPESCRHVLGEWGFLTIEYEKNRDRISETHLPDRQKIIFQLYKKSSEKYVENTGHTFPGYHLRSVMKFVRNYALIKNQLMPDLFQILTAAKGCVDHNYAYEVWELATDYPFLKNIDGLPELDLSPADIWGNSKLIYFHLKEKGRKNSFFSKTRKDRSNFRFLPPGPFSICSFPPEDVAIENFGHFLKKKGTQILTEEGARTIPFSNSLEDGVDVKETIRHLHEKKLYVKARGKPPAGVGSVCIIFNEDQPQENEIYFEKYPWRTTWLGEHEQESDMAFYATDLSSNVVGPGISRCEYGGFMMSYPPRRMHNIWTDPDYEECRTKAEVLLMAAIDYAVKPVVVYVSSTPPRSALKSFARRFGKKIAYIPIGQLSPLTINKLRIFHVLDGHDKREIAGEYIF